MGLMDISNLAVASHSYHRNLNAEKRAPYPRTVNGLIPDSRHRLAQLQIALPIYFYSSRAAGIWGRTVARLLRFAVLGRCNAARIYLLADSVSG